MRNKRSCWLVSVSSVYRDDGFTDIQIHRCLFSDEVREHTEETRLPYSRLNNTETLFPVFCSTDAILYQLRWIFFSTDVGRYMEIYNYCHCIFPK